MDEIDSILAGMPAGPEMGPPAEGEADEAGLDAAADSLIASMQSNDAAGVKQAIRQMFDMLMLEHEKSEVGLLEEG